MEVVLAWNLSRNGWSFSWKIINNALIANLPIRRIKEVEFKFSLVPDARPLSGAHFEVGLASSNPDLFGIA